MSEQEQKKHRSIDEIQKEYQGVCLQVGHLQYQVYTLKKDIDMANQTLRALNVEAAASKEASDKEAAKAAEKPSPAPEVASLKKAREKKGS